MAPTITFVALSNLLSKVGHGRRSSLAASMVGSVDHNRLVDSGDSRRIGERDDGQWRVRWSKLHQAMGRLLRRAHHCQEMRCRSIQ
jgi:hypothetical protein